MRDGLLCLGLSLGMLVGCSEVPNAGLLGEGDDLPAPRIDVWAENSPEALELDFAALDVGDCVPGRVFVANRGGSDLQVESISLVDAPVFAVTDGSEPIVLGPGEQQSVDLRACPARDGVDDGVLRVVSDDPVRPEVHVALLVDGLAAAIEVEPRLHEFEALHPDCSTEVEVTIASVGRRPLVLDSVRFAGDEGLQLVDAPEPGRVVEPDDAVTVTVRWAPAAVGSARGELAVSSNDPAEPEALAEQLGEAARLEPVTDAHRQTVDNVTDVLFVVDDSSSMEGEQTSLAANFDTFIDIADGMELDYRLGVVTTSVESDGTLQGDTPIVTPGTPDPAAAFAANVAVGTDGSSQEQGLHSAMLALDDNPANEGFLRSEAELHILFVSDEPDQSPLPVQDYVDFFASLKADPGDVVLSAVSGGLNGCADLGGFALEAPRYVEAATSTGGIDAPICATDWVDTLAALAWLSGGRSDTFPLSGESEAGSLEVLVDGVPVTEGWSWDPAENAVVFDPESIPGPGAYIDLVWRPAPICA